MIKHAHKNATHKLTRVGAWDLIRFMQWWIVHQPYLPGYIFQNVHLLGDSKDKVSEGRNYICQHFGNSIFVDATGLGSYSHRPQWIWTNLALLSTLAAIFFCSASSFNTKVNDILDPNRTSLPVV